MTHTWEIRFMKMNRLPATPTEVVIGILMSMNAAAGPDALARVFVC